ncbi:cobalt/nickel transport system permease protein [Desulfitispora alkaliphila]|uniref:energy-coupling factor ABC transporter permease n=1 Tax=Desulfitispora alkaliphila TaxID=622674 RepID=UPI003D1D4F33
MHLPDGVVSGQISFLGYGLSFLITVATTIKRELAREMAKISLVTAVLFVASIITIPMGYTTVHFSFLGFAGVLLGPRAFVSVAIAVFLQLMLFKHGGVSTLGINVLNLGMGALVGWLVFSSSKFLIRENERRRNIKVVTVFAGLAGMLAGVTKVGMGSTVLFLSGYPVSVAGTLFAAHVPIFIIEGIATGFLAGALLKAGTKVLYIKNI